MSAVWHSYIEPQEGQGVANLLHQRWQQVGLCLLAAALCMLALPASPASTSMSLCTWDILSPARPWAHVLRNTVVWPFVQYQILFRA